MATKPSLNLVEIERSVPAIGAYGGEDLLHGFDSRPGSSWIPAEMLLGTESDTESGSVGLQTRFRTNEGRTRAAFWRAAWAIRTPAGTSRLGIPAPGDGSQQK